MEENRTPAPDAKEATPVLPNMSAKVYPNKNPKQEIGSVLALASVDLGGCFAVTGIKIVEGKEGPFIAMPRQRGTDGRYHDVCFPTTADMRAAMSAVVMEAYRGELEQQAARAAQAVERLSARAAKPSLQGALQDAVKESAARQSAGPNRTAAYGAR